MKKVFAVSLLTLSLLAGAHTSAFAQATTAELDAARLCVAAAQRAALAAGLPITSADLTNCLPLFASLSDDEIADLTGADQTATAAVGGTQPGTPVVVAAPGPAGASQGGAPAGS